MFLFTTSTCTFVETACLYKINSDVVNLNAQPFELTPRSQHFLTPSQHTVLYLPKRPHKMQIPAFVIALLAVPWALALAAFVARIAMAAKKRDIGACVSAALPLVQEPQHLVANANPTTVPGKYTTQLEGDFVVFIIGLYINHRTWWRHAPTAVRAALALEALRKELSEHPEYGCLLVSHTNSQLTNPTALIQIWRR